MVATPNGENIPGSCQGVSQEHEWMGIIFQELVVHQVIISLFNTNVELGGSWEDTKLVGAMVQRFLQQ